MERAEAGWDGFWDDPDRFRWSAVDQETLIEVARALGWGPHRSLIEIGGGRGEHSKRLWRMGRCGTAHICDTSPAARLVAERCGMPVVETMREVDTVWSYGLVEHFTGPERQAIIEEHFRYAAQRVIIVVPAGTWTRKLSPPRSDTPAQVGYTEPELVERMSRRGWIVTVHSFAPLYGLRHIPDSVYPLLNPIARKLLPGNLIIGNAVRGE